MTEAPDTYSTPYQTVRSSCGGARASYHPEWSASLPWVTYEYGTAGRHFGTAGIAVAHLKRRGFRFSKAS